MADVPSRWVFLRSQPLNRNKVPMMSAEVMKTLIDCIQASKIKVGIVGVCDGLCTYRDHMLRAG